MSDVVYKFGYMYRDGSNYKIYGDPVAVDGWTPELEARFLTALGLTDGAMADGRHEVPFIPYQVEYDVSDLRFRLPFEPLSFGGTYDDDSAWHELSWELDNNSIDQPAHHAAAFVEAFEAAVPWDPDRFDPNRRDVVIDLAAFGTIVQDLASGKTVDIGDRVYVTLEGLNA